MAATIGGTGLWGVLGEVLVDQKFMALFSMLFGAGIVVFHERARSLRAHEPRC